MAAEVENKTLIQNETIILKRECRSKEIFKQLRYLNCLKKEILNSNFYTYYTRGGGIDGTGVEQRDNRKCRSGRSSSNQKGARTLCVLHRQPLYRGKGTPRRNG